MSRLSFSHVLLASFLSIIAILGSAAVGGVLALERFALQSREGASAALAITTAVQVIRERTVDMERSARQYLVLEDASLLERFEEARNAALEAAQPLVASGFEAGVAEWRSAVDDTARALREGGANDAALAALARIAPLNDALAADSRARMHRVNRDLVDELDAHRRSLALSVLAAIVVAVAVAGCTGWWVLRPLKRVEAAIDGLGQSRLDQPIEIVGPADLRELGRRLDWLRVRLADLEANRSRVLRHVSHELKTPLASVREGIALIDDGVVGEITPAQREITAILDQNARTLQQRIEGLLGFNAAIFDAHSVHPRRVALRPLLEEVVAEQQLTLQARHLRVRIEGAERRVTADADKLKVVFGNLLGNAISFSPEGGEVRFILGHRPGWVQIDCVDEGPGVAESELERIFDPFVQGSRPSPHARGGSGLGLSIVREFIAAHRGRSMALSHRGGAYFRIELPDDV